MLFRAGRDDDTLALCRAAQHSRLAWFGLWQGRPAMRFSVSSWRTDDTHVAALIALLADLTTMSAT